MSSARSFHGSRSKSLSFKTVVEPLNQDSLDARFNDYPMFAASQSRGYMQVDLSLSNLVQDSDRDD